MRQRLRTVAAVSALLLLALIARAQSTGACCNALTCACTSAVDASDCGAPNAFHASSSCSPSPCMGWCYDAAAGTCIPSLQDGCETNWNCGGCVLCNVTCCEASSGACIFTSACTCPPGTFYPQFGVCTSNPSPCGACSNPITGACTSPDWLSGCAFASAFFPSSGEQVITCSCPYIQFPSAACSVPIRGVCCDTHSCACVVVPTAGCALGLSYKPGAVSCSSGPCQNGSASGCCPANFDGLNGITIVDVFEFLNAWLAGAPGADFDRDNVLNINDVFAFVDAWFLGC